MSIKSTFEKLKENERGVFEEVFDILLKVLDNVIKSPNNIKYRKLRLANEIVSNKLLPAVGAMETLFEFGFQEADEFLMLPLTVSLQKLKDIREEFLQCRAEYFAQSQRKVSSHVNEVVFFKEIRKYSERVSQYENSDLQAAARKLIPFDELKSRSSVGHDQTDEFVKEFGLIYELMKWFKTEFFQWMDAPKCKKCDSPSIFEGYSTRPEELVVTNRVEEFKCQKCSDRLTFPRYDDPSILLLTRSGRCGEWANCFCLLCRSLGYETRFIFDKTDHVWAEVYSKTLCRWIHCDPCENAVDTPLMYEKGWNKKLSYVIAISNEEVQDVTWRYTTEFENVRTRRNICREEDLVIFLLKLSDELQTSLPPERKTYLTKRRLFECISFLTPAKDGGEYSGRTSGSLQWRLNRNEFKSSSKFFIWEPSEIDIKRKELSFKYSTSKNIYQRIENLGCINGWENGAYEFESIFRKEESDWKKAYLCRTEGSNSGTIKWKFSSKKHSLPIDRIIVNYQCSIFENGRIRWLICNDDVCLPLQTSENFTSIDSFRGSFEFTLTATLMGGNGDNSWQHAQLFRQSMDDDQFAFEIIVKFS